MNYATLSGILSVQKNYSGTMSQETLVLIGKSLADEIIEARDGNDSLLLKLQTLVSKQTNKDLSSNDFTTYLKDNLINLITELPNRVTSEELSGILSDYLLKQNFTETFKSNYEETPNVKTLNLPIVGTTKVVVDYLILNSPLVGFYTLNLKCVDLPENLEEVKANLIYVSDTDMTLYFMYKGHFYLYDATSETWKNLYEISDATTQQRGLMSAQDKTNLNTLTALLQDNNNQVVDTISEVLKAFSNYPDGTDIFQTLSKKVDSTLFNSKVAELNAEIGEIKDMITEAQNLVNEINGEVI